MFQSQICWGMNGISLWIAPKSITDRLLPRVPTWDNSLTSFCSRFLTCDSCSTYLFILLAECSPNVCLCFRVHDAAGRSKQKCPKSKWVTNNELADPNSGSTVSHACCAGPSHKILRKPLHSQILTIGRGNRKLEYFWPLWKQFARAQNIWRLAESSMRTCFMKSDC